MQCPRCGALTPKGARFCEIDGTRLMPEAPETVFVVGGCRCGAGPEALDEQGYCTECGRRSGRQARDHVEIARSPQFSGVTDRGRRHPQNEDDLTLALETVDGSPVFLLVVCDGVSSSDNAQQASATASATAHEILLDAVRAGRADLQEAMAEAIRAANKAVCELPYTRKGTHDPPETTLVAALVWKDVAILGWVGDSRAYWIGPDGGELLTHDHSWINDKVDSGEMTEEEASQAPGAHAITRCLGLWEGKVSEEASEPSFVTFALPRPGRLLLCSDGLWNYAPHPEQIAALLAQAPEDADALTLSRRLIEYANLQGGRDNITVAIATFA